MRLHERCKAFTSLKKMDPSTDNQGIAVSPALVARHDVVLRDHAQEGAVICSSWSVLSLLGIWDTTDINNPMSCSSLLHVQVGTLKAGSPERAACTCRNDDLILEVL